MKKKFDLKVILFIGSGVIAFLTLAFIAFYTIAVLKIQEEERPVVSFEQYYLNQENVESDSFVTKVPGLKDMLAGPIISSVDPYMGASDALVTIVLFSDFECKFCRAQEVVIKNVISKYKDRVRLIWKDYPEYDESSMTYLAAVASRCAQDQGVFWEYHDGLYAVPGELNVEIFAKIANDLNLDRDDFANCFGGKRIRDKVNDNMKEANALQITGIPFIFVNDKEYLGQISEEELEKMIKDELAK